MRYITILLLVSMVGVLSGCELSKLFKGGDDQEQRQETEQDLRTLLNIREDLDAALVSGEIDQDEYDERAGYLDKEIATKKKFLAGAGGLIGILSLLFVAAKKAFAGTPIGIGANLLQTGLNVFRTIKG